MTTTLLLLSADPHLGALVSEAWSPADGLILRRPPATSAVEDMESVGADVVLLDLGGGSSRGLNLCRRIAEHRPSTAVIVVASQGSLELAVEALRAGAYDFLAGPVAPAVLGSAIERALERRTLRRQVRALQAQVELAHGADEILGENSAMQELRELVVRVAPARSSVLIVGESGTGKELVARALHRCSPRAEGPFVALSCAAVPDSLLESELFGHIRGAFTDARAPRPGLFQQAHGGTIFLDEIGDMPASLQPKLLRALQERVVRPLGSDREVEVDVRVLAATHRDLEGLVEQGRFRQDLLYRLDVIRLELPPLRARGADVLLLADHFLVQHASGLGRPAPHLEARAAQKLAEYSWPGNVRELQNCMERAFVLAREPIITIDELPLKLRQHDPRSHVLAATDDPEAMLPMHEVERRYILRVLQAVRGNRGVAARILHLDRKTLYRKLQRYSRDKSRDKTGAEPLARPAPFDSATS